MSPSLEAALAPAVAVCVAFLLASAWLDVRHRAVRMGVLAGSGLLSLRYVWWRFSETVPDDGGIGFVVAVTFLLFETAAIASWQYNYWRAAWATTDRSEEATMHDAWYGAQPPLVDVFIPTYNERLSVLKKTLSGALAQDYANYRVWLLDDGRRDWLREYAAQHGVGYIRRETNSHYKAGNLNHALGYVRGLPNRPDFIAVLDADFVPRTQFLRRTIALTYDPQVALVQTPQEFYNPDPFQYAFRAHQEWPDDLRFLFLVRLCGWDALGSTSCCGTSFVIRDSALDAIGGFPTESVAEDLLTAVKLQRIGHTLVYLNEPLSVGLAAEGVKEHLTQRARWALGLVQVARGAWGPRNYGTWPVNWVRYLDMMLKWGLPSAMRQAFLWAPIVNWFTNYSVLSAEPFEAIQYILPLLVYRGFFAWLEGGATLPLISDAMSLLPGPTVLRATLAGITSTKPKPFEVTDKGTQRAGLTIHWSPLGYFILIGALTIAGIVYRLVLLDGPVPAGLGLLTFFWSGYNLLVLTIAGVPCFERAKYRDSERFESSRRASIALTGRDIGVELVDVSTTGVAFLHAAPGLVPGARVEVCLDGLAALPARIVRMRADGATAAAFELTDAQELELSRRIYASNDFVRPARAWTFWHAMRALIGLKRRGAAGDRATLPQHLPGGAGFLPGGTV